MSETAIRDFQQILAQPVLAYEEGLRFFRGVGLLNETLRRLARDLEEHAIPHCVIGAVALNQHGYQRFTTNINLLLIQEGLREFTEELVGRGYAPAFRGAVKKFRATAENVPIEVILTGAYPGDGMPKPVVFPDPLESSVEINGIRTLTLEKLVELKLASGMSVGRRRDLGDVQELIRVRNLDASFAERLDASVREKFLELHAGLAQSRSQEQAPDWDPEPDSD
jgi:hypothetical protein